MGPRAKFDAGSALSCPIVVPTHILGYTNRDWVMTRNPTYLWPYHIGNVDLCLLDESGPVQTAEAKEKRKYGKKVPKWAPPGCVDRCTFKQYVAREEGVAHPMPMVL